MTPRARWVLAAAAVAVLALHAGALPRSLEDIDSINFALGVEHYDVAEHRPHPPGYPVFVGAAKASTALTPIAQRDRRAALGLAIWGVIAGVAGVFVFAAFWSAAGMSRETAAAAAVVTVAAPLMWFTMARPLSDVAGLVAAIGVQALLLIGWRRALSDGATHTLLLAAAGAAGLAAGVRSQAVWINGPLLVWIAVDLLRHRRGRVAWLALASAAAGVLLWAIPLIWDTGGVAAYIDALRRQGAEDFAGVPMLATTADAQVFERALARTFTEPWLERNFGYAMLLSAIAGLVFLARRHRRTLAIVLVTFLPYLLFHLMFQEVVTLRYSLPVVAAVAGCGVAGWAWLGRRAAIALSAVAAIAGVVIAQPRLQAYSRDGWPLQRAFADMQAAAATSSAVPVVRTHHQVWHGVRRWFDWYRPHWDVGPQPFPGDREWLDIVRHFRTGSTRPVWLLADVRRNDVALFDARARRLGGRYALAPELRELIGAETRLDSATWWQIDTPFWMLGSGWSLTPEIAGVTRLDGLGPQVRPAEGFLRRTEAPVRVLLGGRHLEPGAGPARVEVTVDGRNVADLSVTPAAPWFTTWIDLPAGTLTGPDAYAWLAVRASSPTGSRAPWIGLEQFDAATADAAMMALTGGWHELEHDPATGRTWRWMSSRGVIELRGAADREVRLTIRGESPLRYFDRAPTVVVRAGGRELARFTPAGDFTEIIVIPPDARQASADPITIETDLTFIPGERDLSPDRRQLGLRLFAIEITP